jgi:hypothetical protein
LGLCLRLINSFYSDQIKGKFIETADLRKTLERKSEKSEILIEKIILFSNLFNMFEVDLIALNFKAKRSKSFG